MPFWKDKQVFNDKIISYIISQNCPNVSTRNWHHSSNMFSLMQLQRNPNRYGSGSEERDRRKCVKFNQMNVAGVGRRTNKRYSVPKSLRRMYCAYLIHYCTGKTRWKASKPAVRTQLRDHCVDLLRILIDRCRRKKTQYYVIVLFWNRNQLTHPT